LSESPTWTHIQSRRRHRAVELSAAGRPPGGPWPATGSAACCSRSGSRQSPRCWRCG